MCRSIEERVKWNRMLENHRTKDHHKMRNERENKNRDKREGN